jgi:hypothetical protein
VRGGRCFAPLHGRITVVANGEGAAVLGLQRLALLHHAPLHLTRSARASARLLYVCMHVCVCVCVDRYLDRQIHRYIDR